MDQPEYRSYVHCTKRQEHFHARCHSKPWYPTTFSIPPQSSNAPPNTANKAVKLLATQNTEAWIVVEPEAVPADELAAAALPEAEDPDDADAEASTMEVEVEVLEAPLVDAEDDVVSTD